MAQVEEGKGAAGAVEEILQRAGGGFPQLDGAVGEHGGVATLVGEERHRVEIVAERGAGDVAGRLQRMKEADVHRLRGRDFHAAQSASRVQAVHPDHDLVPRKPVPCQPHDLLSHQPVANRVVLGALYERSIVPRRPERRGGVPCALEQAEPERPIGDPLALPP